MKPPVDPRATPTTVPVELRGDQAAVAHPAHRRRAPDPGARARTDGGDGRTAVDPSAARPASPSARRPFTVETATGTVVLAESRSRRTSPAATTFAAKQHVADRLVAVVVGMSDVSFFGWWQPPGAAAVSSATLDDGRLSAALQLTASDLDRPSDSATRTAVYDLLGPRRRRPGWRPPPSSTPTRRPARRTSRSTRPSTPSSPRRTCRGGTRSTCRRGRRCARGSSCSSERPTRSRSPETTVRLQPSVLDAHPLGGLGAGRARRAGAGRPPDRAPDLAARAHARPRPRRGDRARRSPPPGRRRGRPRQAGRSSSRSTTTGASTRDPAATSPRSPGG